MKGPTIAPDDTVSQAAQLRQQAWDNVVHAEGTRAVFARRAAVLRALTGFRDVLGLSIPVLVAFVATTDWVQNFSSYKTIALAILGGASLIQGLMVIWSFKSKWDEELAYSTRAMRDSYDIKEQWKGIGLGNTQNYRLTFSTLAERQKLLDSHDVEKGITDWEKHFWIRSGLIECQRNCICTNLPTSRKPPRWPRSKCVICGGN